MNEIVTQEKGFSTKPMMAGMMGIMLVIIAIQLLQAPCTPGQTKCVGYDLYLCDETKKWVLLKQNATECGHIPVTAYGCPYCDASFDTLDEVIAHVAAEHPDKPPLGKIDIDWGD